VKAAAQPPPGDDNQDVPATRGLATWPNHVNILGQFLWLSAFALMCFSNLALAVVFSFVGTAVMVLPFLWHGVKQGEKMAAYLFITPFTLPLIFYHLALPVYFYAPDAVVFLFAVFLFFTALMAGDFLNELNERVFHIGFLFVVTIPALCVVTGLAVYAQVV